MPHESPCHQKKNYQKKTFKAQQLIEEIHHTRQNEKS